MADITITVPDEKIARIRNAFAKRYGYEPQIMINDTLVDNPQSRAQFMKAKIAEYIRKVVLQQERDEAKLIAEQTVVDDLDLS
jgi:ribosomal protein S3